MRAVAALSCVAVANAFILPDPKIFEQAAVKNDDRTDRASWWDRVPSKDSIVNTVEDGIDSLSAHIEGALHSLEDTVENKFENLFEEEVFNEPRVSDKTIYELISESEHTTEFAKLVNEYEDIVKVLKSTEANHTLFVPTNGAFEHIPKHHKKPSKEVIEAILKYHVGVGDYDAKRVLRTHTLPTLLDEPFLGDKPQRLRTSVGLGGVRVNFYAKVVAVNIRAKNGIIHAVNSLIIPPPLVGRELTLLPSQFSTLLLAYEKTDFVKFIHGVKSTGTTVFAPSNNAFARLGPKANAFLFNTEIGLKYLKALLKYQIVANATLYSDAFYRPDDKKDAKVMEHYHVDLPTLLDGKNIAVDVATWGGWTKVKLNGYIPIVVADGIAKNGVIHVPGRVPIPPHKHKVDYVDGEITVEDLKERLSEYVENKKKEPDWLDAEL
ncbi:fasciclin domain family protein [Colletotrichum tofieldiae]|uniref:Fasciclin domain family protein n=1 Tax=Colletotrichum tofieldiae TaxID=708197 RepID=A0A161W2K4_9PEZI|nr:fasciclin domain family protein [Colletotrichum tofieldiae]GKT59688.1 fasciclin domain family protein [Colletotrichum tofieldiae]GKT78488.1 fasciclin domain family protein [Colletotrichum tofieldiae]GKT85857.1 fasciclin domain family protein [Colletotrichum tofieldiae]